jgi:hypothetical protein
MTREASLFASFEVFNSSFQLMIMMACIILVMRYFHIQDWNKVFVFEKLGWC